MNHGLLWILAVVWMSYVDLIAALNVNRLLQFVDYACLDDNHIAL